jgi:hypothetical protein
VDINRIITRIIAGLLIVLSAGVQVGASPVSAAPVCQETGENCVVGERGPQGGVIFYDAGSQQWWGRYLEAKVGSTFAGVPWGSTTSLYPADSRQALQRRSMAIGMGRDNTRLMREANSSLATSMFPASEDWYLPSKDELDVLYNYRVLNLAQPATIWNSLPMWSSSESEAGFAWYQLFQDGTQFTDAQGIRPKLASNTNYTMSPVHVGSDFSSQPMNVIKVRAFPVPSPSNPPPATLIGAVRENSDCSTKATGCLVGDKGPAGGIIVYDAGSDKSWGRYLEVAPQTCEIERVAFDSSNSTATIYATAAERVRAKAIGMGASNTTLIASKFAGAARSAKDSKCGGYADWFLPSKDELNEAFRVLSHSRKGLQFTPVGGFDRGYYWTSTDYNGNTAWTQYFADGQQFDRVQTLSANRQPPARPFRVRPMRAFAAGAVGISIPTAPVTSVPAEMRTLTIVGERTTVSGKTGIRVDGVTTGFKDGEIVMPYFRFPGETSFAQGSARLVVTNGEFTWSRKTGKKFYAYITSTDGLVVSNRIIIPAS